MQFKALFGKKILFFDGAMGTMLQAQGLPPGQLPELWNLSHAQVVQDVHRAYVAAGANIIKTNTFGANHLKFKGMQVTVAEVVSAAVNNAKAACAGKDETFVALDLGPTGKLLAPYGDLPFEEAVALYAEVVISGVQAGADLILIETMSDTYELKAAVLAAKENSELPVVATVTVDEDGKLLNGADVQAAAIMLEGLGVDALGFNCGLGPAQLQGLLPKLAAATKLPLVLNPNAGLPEECDGRTVFKVGAAEFAALMKTMLTGDVALAGGCCGTTPEHIKALVDSCKDCIVNTDRSCELTAVCGYGNAVAIGNETIIVGERINPTGKPRLKQAILDGDFDYICRLGLEQLENGAHILDVNMGVLGIDEAAVMKQAVGRLQEITSVPLQLDTSDYAAMAASMRSYNGKPLLNSVNGKEESMSQVFPLAKKYGAVIVALTLDETGIPMTVAGRLTIADKIIARAASYGIDKRNIIIDPLALTISTATENANIDLAVIRALRARGINTILGVSNISFGLPNRDAINSTFFAMAMEAGLSCAIINPQSQAMLQTYAAFGALNGTEAGRQKYLERFAGEAKAPAASNSMKEYTLREAVIKGLQEQSKKAAALLLQTTAPLDIINNELIPALNFVGLGFEEKRLFLPQLLMSAEAAQNAFSVIRASLAQAGNVENNGRKVIVATVQGDIHDIGKNIVKVLFENYGFQVIDLGKDVAPETVVAAAVKYDAEIIGLSALMTTTVGAMKQTIEALKSTGRYKIVVGGAVLTKEYAERIGADHYAPNAVSAVTYANSL